MKPLLEILPWTSAAIAISTAIYVAFRCGFRAGHSLGYQAACRDISKENERYEKARAYTGPGDVSLSERFKGISKPVTITKESQPPKQQ